MNICVCGWYFPDDFYASLWRLNDAGIMVHVVANRNSDFIEHCDLPYTLRANSGLEFGAYDCYLMNIWEGGPTVYMHDDIRLMPIISKDYDIIRGEFAFNKLLGVDCDQAYIFESRKMDILNGGHHGRMIYTSDAFQSACRKQGGFFNDSNNHGYTSSEEPEKRKRMGCLSYNAGIIGFHEQARTTGLNVHCKIYMPSIDMGVRGETGERKNVRHLKTDYFLREDEKRRSPVQ